MDQPATEAAAGPAGERLGLGANWRQFWLLVVVNAFVGGMVGLERTITPLLAERQFGLKSQTATLAFIATFGIVKALANLVAGRLGDRLGRKRVLVAGWLFGLPVPLIVIWAPSWSWIIAANVLLGINQGLAWSTTVIMKIDLVGSRKRGLAMGLNEFAGYLAVALAAFATGEIANRFGLRPEPFYLGIGFAVVGLLLSLLLVRDTLPHVHHEQSRKRQSGGATPTAGAVLKLASWRHPALSAASQAGLVNNLNDGIAWGLFPLYFAASGLSIHQIGMLAAVYPATWGIGQLATGALSDRAGRKWLIVWGMVLQGLALIGMVVVTGFAAWFAWGALLGVGTAMVYPTLLAVVADVTQSAWRASAMGEYRFWRDLGYAAGALVGGLLADTFGMSLAIGAIGGLTIASGIFVAARMPETADLRRGPEHVVTAEGQRGVLAP